MKRRLRLLAVGLLLAGMFASGPARPVRAADGCLYPSWRGAVASHQGQGQYLYSGSAISQGWTNLTVSGVILAPGGWQQQVHVVNNNHFRNIAYVNVWFLNGTAQTFYPNQYFFSTWFFITYDWWLAVPKIASVVACSVPV